jgi:outer membrane immunogenic protein
MLKKLGLAGAASVLIISHVQAADIEAPPAAYDWSGFYVGANLGYAFGDGYDVVATNQIGEESEFGDISLEGINAGVQLGYNFQRDSIVFGVEADAQAADIDDDFNDVAGSGPGTVANFRQEIDFFGTVRARLGFAWDNVLIYATGGYAWANVDVDGDIFDDPATVSWDKERIEDGYTVGGGLEFGVGDDVTVKAEYLYIDLGSENLENDSSVPPGISDITFDVETKFHLVRVGVNWRF